MQNLSNDPLMQCIQSIHLQDDQPSNGQREKQLSLLKEVLESATSHKPLSDKILRDCFQLLASADHESNDIKSEDIPFAELEAYLLQMQNLFPQHPEVDTVGFIEYLSDQLLKFDKLKIFPKYNRQIGLIIVAYLVAHAGYPLFSFDTQTSCPFNLSEALHSPSRMRWYLAELIKAQIKDELGNIIPLKEHYEYSSAYASSDKDLPSTTIFHWHELNKAIKIWKQAH